MLNEFEKERRRIFLERDAVHGPAIPAHKNLGLIWTAQIQQYYGIELDEPIPAELVFLMMAGSKLTRASKRNYVRDDYIDGSIYIDLAHVAILEKRKQADEKN